MGLNHFLPLRSLVFLGSGDLFASSYEGGLYRVFADTLRVIPSVHRSSWAMKVDAYDRIWLAGKQGVFVFDKDTLRRFTTHPEALDVDFYRGYLAVAHRAGITLFDTASGTPGNTRLRGITCWSIDVYDSLLIGTGVEKCLIVNGSDERTIPIGPRHNIPWAAVADTTGVVYLATQKGLLRVLPGERHAECIAFKGKCIKSICFDRAGRLWVGRYFRE